jgi:flagellar biosynthesis anti-sigma factor FlgM
VKPVNINGPNYLQKPELSRPETGQKPSEVSKTTAEHATPDSFRLSDRGEQVRQLVARANELSEIRGPRVARIRQLIQSGQFKVSANDIADAIIRDEVR